MQTENPVGNEEFNGYLEKLFIEDLRIKLKQKAIDAISSEIDNSVSAVIDELKPKIKSFLHQNFDPQHRGLYGDVLVKLVLEKPVYAKSL